MLSFLQIRNLCASKKCCLNTVVKRHIKATQLLFLLSTGARLKTLIQRTLGRWPFQEPWKQFLFDQQTRNEIKRLCVVVFLFFSFLSLFFFFFSRACAPLVTDSDNSVTAANMLSLHE